MIRFSTIMIKLSKILRLLKLPYKCYRYLYYKVILGSIGNHSYIDHPLRIDGAKTIYIGKGVSIKYKSWIASKPLTGADSSKLVFEDGCVIGHFNHIFSTKSIIFHKNVLTADRVYISDNLHGYEEIDIPIVRQPVVQNGTVEIGEGSWIGENVCITGASIGKHCVIGANAVVTHDIPDYCVAVGIPARIVKKYDFSIGQWRKTDKNGVFI